MQLNQHAVACNRRREKLIAEVAAESDTSDSSLRPLDHQAYLDLEPIKIILGGAEFAFRSTILEGMRAMVYLDLHAGSRHLRLQSHYRPSLLMSKVEWDQKFILPA
jgi:hypothetical protein